MALLFQYAPLLSGHKNWNAHTGRVHLNAVVAEDLLSLHHFHFFFGVAIALETYRFAGLR